MNNFILSPIAEKTVIFRPDMLDKGSKGGGAKMILKTNNNEYVVTFREDGKATIFGGILKRELPCRELAPFSIGHSAHFEVYDDGDKYAMHTSPLVSISR